MNSNGQRHKILITAIIILLLANIGLLLFLFLPKKDDHRRGGGDRPRDMLAYSLEEKVGFDQQQIAAYKQLKDSHKLRMKPLFEDLRTSKEQLYNYLQHPTSDSNTLKMAAQQIGEKQEEIDLLLFKHFSDLRALCRPQQLPAFDSVIQRTVYKIIGRKRTDSKKDSSKTKEGQRAH